jgi:hypothetical protein
VPNKFHQLLRTNGAKIGISIGPIIQFHLLKREMNQGSWLRGIHWQRRWVRIPLTVSLFLQALRIWRFVRRPTSWLPLCKVLGIFAKSTLWLMCGLLRKVGALFGFTRKLFEGKITCILIKKLSGLKIFIGWRFCLRCWSESGCNSWKVFEGGEGSDV